MNRGLPPSSFLRYYLDLVLYKAWADLKSEASRYYISYLWWVLGPVLEMFVYYLVFAVLMRRGTDQFICFLIIGILFWNWFSSSVQHCSNAIATSKSLVQKVPLPKVLFPVIIILEDTFKFLISFVIIMASLHLMGLYEPSLSLSSFLYLPAILVTELACIAALGFFCAAVVPFLPDLTIVITYGLRLMFFLSGIFYDGRMLPEPYQKWFFMNPMARIIDDARAVLLGGQTPDPTCLALILGAAVLLGLLGAAVIHRFDREYPRVLAQ